MIELRWLEKWHAPRDVGDGVMVHDMVRVLQFRQLVDRHGLDCIYKDWSDWRDVPTEVTTLRAESAAPSDDHDHTEKEGEGK